VAPNLHEKGGLLGAAAARAAQEDVDSVSIRHKRQRFVNHSTSDWNHRKKNQSRWRSAMNAIAANVFAPSVPTESGSVTPRKGAEIFSLFSSAYARERREVMGLTDYLEGCRDDPSMYATAAERMIAAIGEPKVIDTSKDLRLGRIFLNRTIKIYPSLAGFFGMEDTIQRVVSYFQHAAQGLEERKQILYLLGPVGGGKSSLAERLKHLMESRPIYVLAAGEEISPIFESPLGLFRPDAMAAALEKQYAIPPRRLTGICSPWAAKRLDQFDGDLSKFSVVKMYPSKLRQIGVAKTEPGDENNQDISALVGKIDIRKLEHFSQHDPDAYSYSGGLNRTTQGLLEFVEMFKAPIKVLHPLLTAPCRSRASSSPIPTSRNGSTSRTTGTTKPSSTVFAWSRFPTACASAKRR
jgi:serine protein kinase